MNQAAVLDPRSARWLPWLVAVAFFMQMLDGTILNTALPAMARNLGADPLRMQAVLIAYMLTVAIFIPASGWLTDRLGPNRLMSGAISLFTFGSLLCAVSPNLTFMIVSRVVQALGGALMVPVGRLVILRAYPREQLIQVLSFITMPGLAGSVAGPAVGGLLVEYASWRWIFLINLPIGILGVIMTRRLMPRFKTIHSSPFDLLGFVVFSSSLVLITLALEGFGDLGLPLILAGGLLAAGLVIQILYWFLLSGRSKALFKPRLFKNLTFALGLAGGILTRLGTGSTPFLLPLLLQVVLGFPPAMAGLLMIPLALASLITKMLAKPLTVRFGYRLILIFNTLVQGSLVFSFGFIGLTLNIPLFLAHVALLGAVNALQFSVINTFTLLQVPDEDAAGGNTLLSVVIQVAQSLAVGVAALILIIFNGSPTVSAGFDAAQILPAFHRTFQIIGIISMLSSSLFLLAPKDRPRKSYKSRPGQGRTFSSG